MEVLNFHHKLKLLFNRNKKSNKQVTILSTVAHSKETTLTIRKDSKLQTCTTNLNLANQEKIKHIDKTEFI